MLHNVSELFIINHIWKHGSSCSRWMSVKMWWGAPDRVILNHSWSPFFLLTYLYAENELLWGSVHSFGVFLQEKFPPVSRVLICNETLTKLSLSNIMKHGESDVERQISIQGILLNVLLKIFGKEKEALNHSSAHGFAVVHIKSWPVLAFIIISSFVATQAPYIC